jgi:dihydropteroate synthase
VQNTAFLTNKTLNVNGRLIDLETPRVMGILNVTPDSFYDGGRFESDSAILRHVEEMLTEGADFIDVGGYSTRPGAAEITVKEESERVLKVIKSIKKHFSDTAISIDTFRSEVASAAIAEGAGLINDVSGGQLDEKMFEMVARLKVPYILMHMRGNPKTMTKLTMYDDLITDLINFFHHRINVLTTLGVKDIIIDPGFGFAKTREQNFHVLDKLDSLKIFGRPILTGLSRKSIVWKTLDISAEEALNGTTALHAIALYKGASIIRAHDVKECVQVIRLIEQVKRSSATYISKSKE